MPSEVRLVLGALIRHYQRHPLQALFLLVGLMLGVVMITGIHAINQRARLSYAEADSAFGQQEILRIENLQPRGTVPQSLYVKLRRAGLDQSLPVLEGDLLTAAGQRVRLTGLDPLSLPAYQAGSADIDLTGFILPPYSALVGVREARRLGLEDGAELDLEGNRSIGPVRVVEDDPLLGNRLLVDIGAAQQLLSRPGQVSWISVFELQPGQRATLRAVLPPQARIVEMNDPEDLAQLTRSFHLNLTAMSLLAFIVGLFIVYNAVSYTVLQRKSLIARLRMLGVSRRAVVIALLIELSGWVMLGSVLGFVGGLALADQLSPAVTDTLENLYGSRLVPGDQVQWRWLLEAIAMTAAGTALACGRRLWQLGTTPPVRGQTLSGERHFVAADHRLQALLGGGLALAALAFHQLGSGHLNGLATGFATIACSLLAAALLLPSLLSALAAGVARLAGPRPVVAWAAADVRSRMGRLGVAMMAFMLAMAANVGINTMVGSFRLTFLDWLDQRLSADLYIRSRAEDGAAMVRWLSSQPSVARVAELRETVAQAEGQPTDIIGMDQQTLRSTLVFKSALASVWQAVDRGHVLISENLALNLGIGVGDTLKFGDDRRQDEAGVAGVVYDYGNPRGRVYLAQHRWLALWPETPPQSLGVYYRPSPGTDRMPGQSPTQTLNLPRLRERFDLAASQLIDQATVKDLSVSIFERTFAITRAMNALTLIVAGIGLLCALLATEGFRYRELAQLRALGVSTATLRWAGLGQIGLLAAITCLLSIPVGILLAWQLVNVVNVQAFGWSFPLQLFPADYLRLSAVAVGVALIAAAWPSWRQSRVNCSRWLQLEPDA